MLTSETTTLSQALPTDVFVDFMCGHRFNAPEFIFPDRMEFPSMEALSLWVYEKTEEYLDPVC
jgi:hypothetical protein